MLHKRENQVGNSVEQPQDNCAEHSYNVCRVDQGRMEDENRRMRKIVDRDNSAEQSGKEQLERKG